MAALAAVRRRGARLAIDDTGSGYAGLTSVMRLAPDVIKLDRTLVAGVASDPVKAALIESFVRYAREIDAHVCAEASRSSATYRLADLDVSYGQGYGLGRPAAPLAGAAPDAVATCQLSFTVSLAGRADAATGDVREHALEEIVVQVSGATEHAELAAARGLIAAELRADQVTLLRRERGSDELHAVRTGRSAGPVIPGSSLLSTLREGRLEQVLATDPLADQREIAILAALGFRSVLRLPLTCEDRVVGVLEVHSRSDRPWSRFEIRRARIIAHQLGAALERIERRTAGLYSR